MRECEMIECGGEKIWVEWWWIGGKRALFTREWEGGVGDS